MHTEMTDTVRYGGMIGDIQVPKTRSVPTYPSSKRNCLVGGMEGCFDGREPRHGRDAFREGRENNRIPSAKVPKNMFERRIHQKQNYSKRRGMLVTKFERAS